MLTQYVPEREEDLIDVLDTYKCFRKLSADNLCEILSKLAHQEIIQHPRYVGNSFRQVFKAVTNHPFVSKDDLVEFYKKREPTNEKVIRALKVSTNDTKNDAKRNVISHLHRCIKSLNKKDLALFLRFVTGADIMPEFEIVVAFITCPPLVPRSRTCIPQVELHETCGHYNELAEAFENVLKSPESFFFFT